MRVIIRFSLDGDEKKRTPLRNKLRKILEGIDLKLTGTSTYEGHADPDKIAEAMTDFWNTVNDYEGAEVDHFWMYTD